MFDCGIHPGKTYEGSLPFFDEVRWPCNSNATAFAYLCFLFWLVGSHPAEGVAAGWLIAAGAVSPNRWTSSRSTSV